MFRRESDVAYDVVGVWGSGNVVATRDGLSDGTATGFTMWDGHALYGPGRPGSLERFPSISAILPLSIFLDRFSSLGSNCEYFSGDEVLGFDCELVCSHLSELCGITKETSCISDCSHWPRAITDCLQTADVCETAEAECGTTDWANSHMPKGQP